MASVGLEDTFVLLVPLVTADCGVVVALSIGCVEVPTTVNWVRPLLVAFFFAACLAVVERVIREDI
jgi:hypothetical protein